LDIRHEPTEDDALMLEYIRESGRKLIVVANKSDKISRSEQKRHIDRIRNVLNLSSDIDIIPISSLKKTGIEALWERIEMSL
jgi:GTP-binding protein